MLDWYNSVFPGCDNETSCWDIRIKSCIAVLWTNLWFCFVWITDWCFYKQFKHFILILYNATNSVYIQSSEYENRELFSYMQYLWSFSLGTNCLQYICNNCTYGRSYWSYVECMLMFPLIASEYPRTFFPVTICILRLQLKHISWLVDHMVISGNREVAG